jgi:DeoR/GlpR family transcriptional regulator of sugar metabolism
VLAVERRARIVAAVQARRVVSTDDLAQELAVSTETVRRDLAALGRSGAVQRVHGGVTAGTGAHLGAEGGFTERAALALEAKARIGTLAATLVRPGQTVVLDVGTTVLAAARELPAGFTGTVATCSLLVAAELAGRPGVDVLIAPGHVRGGDLAVSGAAAVDFFADLHADLAFLGSGGLSATAGLSDFHHDEVAVRRRMLANAARSFVLVDATKFDRVAPHRVCPLHELTGVIADAPASEPLARAVEHAGIDWVSP